MFKYAVCASGRLATSFSAHCSFFDAILWYTAFEQIFGAPPFPSLFQQVLICQILLRRRQVPIWQVLIRRHFLPPNFLHRRQVILQEINFHQVLIRSPFDKFSLPGPASDFITDTNRHRRYQRSQPNHIQSASSPTFGLAILCPSFAIARTTSSAHALAPPFFQSTPPSLASRSSSLAIQPPPSPPTTPPTSSFDDTPSP